MGPLGRLVFALPLLSALQPKLGSPPCGRAYRINYQLSACEALFDNPCNEASAKPLFALPGPAPITEVAADTIRHQARGRERSESRRRPNFHCPTRSGCRCLRLHLVLRQGQEQSSRAPRRSHKSQNSESSSLSPSPSRRTKKVPRSQNSIPPKRMHLAILIYVSKLRAHKHATSREPERARCR